MRRLTNAKCARQESSSRTKDRASATLAQLESSTTSSASRRALHVVLVNSASRGGRNVLSASQELTAPETLPNATSVTTEIIRVTMVRSRARLVNLESTRLQVEPTLLAPTARQGRARGYGLDLPVVVPRTAERNGAQAFGNPA